MGLHDEEQTDEVDALESIYPDSFELISKDPYCFSLIIATAEADVEDDDVLTVSVQFTFSSEYPDVGPDFEVLSTDGFPEDDHIDKIIDLIKDQIENNLGMVMIFTIVSELQDLLNQTKDDMIRVKEEEKERKIREIQEAEERKSHGTPVTVATFLVWKTKFDMEMAELQQKMQSVKKDKKLSGKEIFLQMKIVSDDAELLEGEVEAVEVDESLFDNVEDLELEDD